MSDAAAHPAPIVQSKSGGPLGLLLVAMPVLLVVWLVIWPIVSAIAGTVWLQGDTGAAGFSLRTYLFFFSDQYSINNLLLTLWTTGVVAVLLLLLCMPIALYLRFATGRLASYVQGLAIFPMFVPSIILSYAFIRVLGPNGMVDILLNASPVGMLDDARMPISVGRFDPKLVVFDAIVKPEMTPLLQLAAASGCTFIQGRQMMLGQISKMTDYFGIPAPF